MRAMSFVLTPLHLNAHILAAEARVFFSLPFRTLVDRLAPPPLLVPSSLAATAGLSTLALELLVTALASLCLEATTTDLAIDTCIASLSWNACTTRSTAAARRCLTNWAVPRTAIVRSSTYSVSRTDFPQELWASASTSRSKSLSSEVAKPEPAVMPRVAFTVLEKQPSTPIVRDRR